MERIGLLLVACLYGVVAAVIVTIINVFRDGVACLVDFVKPLYEIPTATDKWISAHNEAVDRRDLSAYMADVFQPEPKETNERN